MKQKQLMIILLVLFINIKKRSWRQLPKYYKSLAYVSFFNCFYYYICKRYLLWEFTAHGFQWRILRAVHIFIVAPLITLGCLSNFPSSINKQIIHIFKWTIGSTLVEYIAVKNKILIFKHGWNILWSSLIYLQMYTFSYYHTKNPLQTWICSIFFVVSFIIKFNVPLKKRLLKGPFCLFFHKDKPFFSMES
ncbi:hypothetical protein BKP45_15795 [Anaerobacillus alkalidiazotrophicus]|uniref:Uncharacterized protein n=1 Tax=Anaerobacillus alkalidiazotrophicus TaxID=472963 RepID=A0A1S2M2E8_9BACI|nr:hypothetical protein BKP45_15795 [Anaerobacillus alkalidiazotrophicus]